MNGYWESKIPKFEKIKIPAYVTGGWSHLHLRGAVTGFRKIRSPKKWLRIHREFEWPDTYAWWNLEDLKRFFDRYLKGIRNGWELTPRVRIEVMDAYDYDFQVNRPEKEFPLARTQYKKLYLDAGENASGGALSWEPVGGRDEGFLRRERRAHHLRYHLHRGRRAHRLHEGPPLGGGRRSRRDGPLPHRAEAGRERASSCPRSFSASRTRGPGAGCACPTGRSIEDLSTDYQPVQSHQVRGEAQARRDRAGGDRLLSH